MGDRVWSLKSMESVAWESEDCRRGKLLEMQKGLGRPGREGGPNKSLMELLMIDL